MPALWGLFADMGCQAVVTLSTFLLTPLVLLLTSKSLYGSWQAALSILSYLAMLDAGLGFSLVRLVASAMDNRGTRGLNSLSSAAFFSFAGIGLTVLLVGLALASRIPGFFHVPISEQAAVVQAYRLAALAGAAGLPLGTFNSILVGLQRTPAANTLRALGALLGAVVTVVLLECHLGISALAISSLASSVCGGLLAVLCVRKVHPEFAIRLRLVSAGELSNLWRVAGYFQLVRIAYIVALNSDALIIAAVLGASQVTPYVLTLRMAIMFSVVLADKAPSAVYPAFAQMYARGEMESLRRSFIALTYYSARLAIMGAALVAVLNPVFVRCWVGSHAYGGDGLNAVFVYWVLVDTILRGTALIPLVTADMRTWAIISVVEALVNVGSSLLLVRPFGLLGVAIGTALARTCVTGAVMPFWSCRKLGIRYSHALLTGIFRPAVKSIPIIGVAALVSILLPASMTWMRLFVVTVCVIVTSIAVFEGPKWVRKRSWTLRELLGELLRPDLASVPATSVE